MSYWQCSNILQSPEHMELCAVERREEDRQMQLCSFTSPSLWETTHWPQSGSHNFSPLTVWYERHQMLRGTQWTHIPMNLPTHIKHWHYCLYTNTAPTAVWHTDWAGVMIHYANAIPRGLLCNWEETPDASSALGKIHCGSLEVTSGSGSLTQLCVVQQTDAYASDTQFTIMWNQKINTAFKFIHWTQYANECR